MPVFALVTIFVLVGIPAVYLIPWDTIFPPPRPEDKKPPQPPSEPKGSLSTAIQPKIVGKQVPPGYVWGNPIDDGLQTGISIMSIGKTGEKVSFRFSPQFSGDIQSITINTPSSVVDSMIRVGLQGDSSGTPQGEWISEGIFRPKDVRTAFGFVTATMINLAPVSKGKVYHVVIEAAEPISTSFPIATFQSNALARPLNGDDPDITSPDLTMNVFSYDGVKWREENKWPIFVVKYSDGRSEGQPYSLLAQWVVDGSTYVGQTIIPASNYKLGKIAYLVSLKREPISPQEGPKDSLYYEIRGSSNEVLAKGLFAEASQLTIRKQWIEATLPSPVMLTAGKLYRIVLLSPGTSLDDAYHLYGDEFSADSSIGYGGLQHQLTTSHDGGVSWSDNADADAVFKFITAP